MENIINSKTFLLLAKIDPDAPYPGTNGSKTLTRIISETVRLRGKMIDVKSS